MVKGTSDIEAGPAPADDGEGFRGPQVCKLVGITYRQLDYWARTGLMVPSLASARGSGTQRRYSYKDLVELKVIKRLLDAGISLQSTRKALACLKDSVGGDLAAAHLVINGNDSVLLNTGEEIVDLLKGGQGVLNIVPLGGVVQELDSAIHDLFPAVTPEAVAAPATPPAVSQGG